MYYWTTYVKRNVSFLFKGRAENWGEGEGANATHIETVFNPLQRYSKPRMKLMLQCDKFLCEIVHVSGATKPWLKGPPEPEGLSNETKRHRARQMWFGELGILNEKLAMGLNFSNWHLKGVRPPQGFYARPAY